MTIDRALNLFVEKYGFLKAIRLVSYCAAIATIGTDEFDRQASRPHRRKIWNEARLAGVDPEAVTWDQANGAVGALSRMVRRQGRATASPAAGRPR
ncbi:MAG TPA: hypothetical protein DCP25_00575 [Chloroflexi bacterium]|jgi:hypothetical protein|nr:hypothetical protein [Chloroflexota bacterium]